MLKNIMTTLSITSKELKDMKWLNAFKHLGVTLNGTWSSQVNNVHANAFNSLKPSEILREIHYYFMYSHIQYGMELLENCSKIHRTGIQLSEKNALIYTQTQQVNNDY